MKKILSFTLAALCGIIFLSACSSAKKTTENTTVSRNELKGNWIVTSTSVEGADASKLKITAFDDVALGCFNGSTWSFPNSNYGSYTVNNSACEQGARKIIWSQKTSNGISYLKFKHMDDLKRNKARTVADGYSLEITQSDKTHFTAKSPLSFDGKTIYIVYQFEKQ